MSAGDASIAINADGRSATVRVLGVGAGGTYLYDSANSSLVDEATAKIELTVVSKSFDQNGSPTTISRKVLGLKTQRVPGVATLNETVVGSDLDIVIALSEPIYAKDKAGAGNSGTDVSARFLANWYTQGGTSSNAATITATNNSALAYYVPFGQWDMLPAERVDNDFRVAFAARHLHGIAAVVFSATGSVGHSTAFATAATEIARQRPATLLYGTAHEQTIPIAGFVQSEQLNLRARAYPLVGDVELDTDNFTVAGGYYEVEGRGPRYAVCDKNDSLRTYAYVTLGASGGTASTTEATAEADPFPTIKAALDADATQVYLNGAAHTFDGRSVSKSSAHWTTIEPAPGNNSTVTVAIPSGFPSWMVTRLKLKNVTIKPTDGTSFVSGGLTDYIALEGCSFDSNGVSRAQHTWYNYLGAYYKDGSFDDIAKWPLNKSGGDTQRICLDGCSMPASSSTAVNAIWRMIGCRPSGPIQLSSSVLVGTAIRNLLIEFNYASKVIVDWQLFDQSTNSGYSFIGNILEGTNVSPGQLLSMTEAAPFDVDHVLFCHNTIVGQRANVAYNDTGSTAYFRRGWRMVGNIFGQSFNTKHDLFNGGSGVDAARIGGWPVDWGTSRRSNLQGASIAGTFPGDYAGIRWTASATFDFADDKSGDGGAGDGDYSLGPDSQARNYLAAGDRVVPFDLFGTSVRDNGTGAAGAIQPAATARVGKVSEVMDLTGSLANGFD